MINPSYEKVDGFLRSLEEALEVPGTQTSRIVAEVRGDLELQVERLKGEGLPEEEAVSRVLAELGNPYELAHRMRREIPPFSGPGVTAIRYLLAGGVSLLMLALLWRFRAWTYGLSLPVLSVIVLFHLPPILLLWPRIVWRRNWLFSIVPAAAALVVVIMVVTLGQQEETDPGIVIEATESQVEPSPVVEVEVDEVEAAQRARLVILACGLGVIGFLLLMAMQRRGQRRVVILVLLLVVGSVESAFQVEEWLFRKDVERVRNYFEATFRESGAYPEAGELNPRELGIGDKHHIRVQGENYSLFWGRPLSSGFSLIYSSSDEQVRVQD